ncbi:unnamed protein product [Schistosoma mattheei]|uniref:Uncharacterized protein n=1 Tax=Schistosoma mattheei TaxID=31246 RepID=A0A183Q7Q3_9TREM|nr:unnamed protein product [Schistosoma mattheei]
MLDICVHCCIILVYLFLLQIQMLHNLFDIKY